ncbi:MAG: hypothetical protein AB7G17_11565 [Phycisphaerales bacterium]
MRRYGVALVIVVTASAGVIAHPSGLPVHLVETFDPYTPGLTATNQARIPGCPSWAGGWFVRAHPGGTTDLLMSATPGASSADIALRSAFPFSVFAEGTTDAVLRAEMFTPSLVAFSTMRVDSVGAGFAVSSASWGGLQIEFDCAGTGGPPALYTTFFVSDVCSSVATPAQYINTHATVPLGAWYSLELRTMSDGTLIWTFDPMDGSPPVELRRSVIPTPGGEHSRIRFEQVSTTAGNEMFIDNFVLSGHSRGPVCAGDADRDGVVGFDDLNLILGAYGTTNGSTAHEADVNADGVINFADLNITLSAFGTACGCVP